jgi:nitrite reductase/ring-hydroxylating ferredoxin subunit
MIRRLLICAIALVTLVRCDSDITDDPIPWQPFDVLYLNLNLPEYVALKSDGGILTIDDAGVRGIIVYRQNNSNYIAYERNCSFQPNSACATVDIHASHLFLFCSCCSSSFDFATGLPTGGPAWRPLRRYYTSLNGTTLTITDEIVE